MYRAGKIAEQRANDLVFFEGLVTGKPMGERVARAARELGQCSGKLIVVKFPDMMSDLRENSHDLRDLVNGRKVKAHSAGTLVAKELVNSDAKPAWLELYNEVAPTSEAELVKGGFKRVIRHAAGSLPLPGNGHLGANFRVTADSIWQSVTHGPSNYGHIEEISEYSAAEHLPELKERGVKVRRLIGLDDEFPTFAQAVAPGIPTCHLDTCHDGILLQPTEMQQQLAAVPFVG